jgi:hypothetical protein
VLDYYKFLPGIRDDGHLVFMVSKQYLKTAHPQVHANFHENFENVFKSII